jgi:hypothetical protein
MKRRPSYDINPWWRRRSLVIPPDSPREWFRFAAWEIWMGIVLLALISLGAQLIVTAPDRLIAVLDLSLCYGAPPVPIPCERTLYRGGAINVAFSALSGFIMIVIAAWLLWQLWSLTEPRPIADDFLRLLHDSFGRSWRNPLTWPWARVLWAYGFTAVGAAVAAGIALTIASLVSPPPKPLAPRIDTSQSFRSTR